MNAQQIRGRWDQIRGKVKEKWGQLTDDDLQIVSGNVDQVVGRIEQKTGEARSSVERFLDDLVSDDSPLIRAKDAAVGYAQSAAHSAREGFEHAKEHAVESYERAGRLVQRHPAQSMTAVFALGVLTGVAVGLMLRSNA